MQNQWKKRICLLGLLLVFLLHGYSQKYAKTYYDQTWRLTTKNLAYYCRTGFIDTLNYQYYGVVNDYYVATGKLQMTGNYLANSKNGSFNFYYPDGTLKTEGLYKDNVRAGIWTNYYKNGSFRDKVLYDNNFVKALTYYDTNGIQKLSNGTGEWQADFLNDYSFEYVQIKGNYLNSQMDGIWNTYGRKLSGGVKGEPVLQRSEKYINGKFVTGKSYLNGYILDQDKPKQNLIVESSKFFNTETWQQSEYASIEEYPYLKFLKKIDSTVFPVDSYAAYHGGLDSVATAVQKGIKLPKNYGIDYPKAAYIIIFEIDQYGSLIIKNENSYDDIFYKQAIKSVKKLTDWKPAKRNSQAVINLFTLFVYETDGSVGVELNSNNDLTGDYKSGITYYY